MFKIILILFSLNAFALLEFEDATSPELVKSARALAMGNAYLNAVDDGWSAFYNPAGLGTVRKLQFHLGNIHIEMNKGFLDATSGQGSFTDAFSKYGDAFKADGIQSLLAKNPGTSLARIQAFPNITYRYFTLGYMYADQNWARMKSATSDFEIARRVDSGPVAAFNVSLFGGILKLGLSGVLLHRRELQKDFTAPVTSVSVNDSDYKEGTTTHLTAGMRFTMPFRTLPTISVVHRSFGTTGWYDVEGTAPSDIEKTTDVSFSVTPIFSRTVRIHLEAGMRDIGNQFSNVDSSRKLNAGLEIGFMRKMFVRFGYADGWGSGGIGVRNRKFIFDLSTYAVEAGAGNRDQEDRRYALSISSGF